MAVQTGQPVGLGVGMPGQNAEPPVVWATPSKKMPRGCPKGLQLLLGLDTLFVRQSVDVWELLTGWEQANRYEVFNVYGQRLYLALEMQNGIMCGGGARAFEMALVDSGNVEQLHISRPFHFCSGDVATVTVGGVVVGSVQQAGFKWDNIALCDASGAQVLSIESHFLVSGIADEFALKGGDGVTTIGRVAKQWSGLMKEMLTDADNFGVNFPADLSVQMKATVLAATFLIDFMFYETSPNHGGRYGRYGHGLGYGYGGGYGHGGVIGAF